MRSEELMRDVYRQPEFPPVVFEFGESSLYVVNADIMFRCEACKAEWRFGDTFNLSDTNEDASFHHLQLAWNYKHQACR